MEKLKNSTKKIVKNPVKLTINTTLNIKAPIKNSKLKKSNSQIQDSGDKQKEESENKEIQSKNHKFEMKIIKKSSSDEQQNKALINSNSIFENIDFQSQNNILDEDNYNFGPNDSSHDSIGSFNKPIPSLIIINEEMKNIESEFDNKIRISNDYNNKRNNGNRSTKKKQINTFGNNKINFLNKNVKDSISNFKENLNYNHVFSPITKKPLFDKINKSNQKSIIIKNIRQLKQSSAKKENSVNIKPINVAELDIIAQEQSKDYNFEFKFFDKYKRILNSFPNSNSNSLSSSINNLNTNIIISPTNKIIPDSSSTNSIILPKYLSDFNDERETGPKKIFYLKSIFKNKQQSLFVMNRDNSLFKNPNFEKYSRRIENFIYFFEEKEAIENEIIYVKAYKDAPKCIIGPIEHAGCKFTKNIKKSNLIWKLYKFDKMVNLIKSLNICQKYNHFPKTFQLGRKDNLWKNFKKFKRKFPNEYNYHPQAFIIPDELSEFKQFAKINSSYVWIMKPQASSRGRGIRLLTSFDDIPKECLICKYIEKPHLINNKKYDLRIYVLITSFTPLKIFLFKDGLVRFASEEYTKGNKDNIYIHLTNYAVNKKNKNYAASDDDGSGSKWTLNAYERFFIENNMHDKFKILWEKIKDIVIKTLISAAEESANYVKVYSKHDNILFELYGFDIIIDSEFNPWLLEVNVNPSLNCDTELDYNVKTNLITDIINIIGLKPFSEEFLVENSGNSTNKHISSQIKKNSNGTLPSIKINGNSKNSTSEDKTGNNYNNNNLGYHNYFNLGNNPQNVSISQVRIENKRNFMSDEPDFNFNYSEDIVKNHYQNFLKTYEDEIFRSKFTNFDCIFPMAYNVRNYINFYKVFDDESIVLWKWLISKKPIDKFE